MTTSAKIIASAPGKLILAGEWAVLEEGNQGIVTAVNKRCQVTFSTRRGRSPLHVSTVPERFETSAPLLEEIFELVKNVFGHLPSGDLHIDSSELHVHGKKLGLGSSAAVAIAVIAALTAQPLSRFCAEARREIILKLSLLAHFRYQDESGSGIDCAAAAYGGTINFKRVSPKWLNQFKTKQVSLTTFQQSWPGLSVRPLRGLNGFLFVAGWSGTSASSARLLQNLHSSCRLASDKYQRLLSNFASAAAIFQNALEQHSMPLMQLACNQHSETLRALSSFADTELEPTRARAMLTAAIELGQAAKLSGAGGGDCCIAVCSSRQGLKAVSRRWRELGAITFSLHPPARGLSIRMEPIP